MYSDSSRFAGVGGVGIGGGGTFRVAVELR